MDLLLDDHPDDIVMAASMRLLRSAYAGNCLNLEDGDGNYFSYGFDGNGWLDADAIEAQLGPDSYDGNVRYLYDQGANANDFTQLGTGSLRPLIADNGTAYKLTGDAAGAVARPSLRFEGDYVIATPGGISNEITIAMVAQRVSTHAAGTYATAAMLANSYSSSGSYLMAVWEYFGDVGVIPNDVAKRAVVPRAVVYPTDTVEQITITLSSGVASYYRRGELLARSVRSSYDCTLASVILGGWSGNLFDGYISEFVLWDVAKSDEEIIDISLNQMGAWGIESPVESGGGGSPNLTRRLQSLAGVTING